MLGRSSSGVLLLKNSQKKDDKSALMLLLHGHGKSGMERRRRPAFPLDGGLQGAQNHLVAWFPRPECLKTILRYFVKAGAVVVYEKNYYNF